MTTLTTITAISILLSTFWLFKKPKTKLLEKYLTKIHFIFLGLAVLVIVLLLEGLRFIGQYTNSIIGVTFLSSGILLFGLTTAKNIKVYSRLIAIPALLIEISVLVGGSPLLIPALIGYSMFAPPQKQQKVNDKYNIEIHQGVLLAPPNLFYLTKRTALIFDKRIRLTASERAADISKIEIISFTENENVVCKFYNSGSPPDFYIDTLRYKQ